MKTNRLGLSVQDNTPPVANAAEIASCLLYSFEQFGIKRDGNFAERSSVIAFANVMVLVKGEPDETPKLLDVVKHAGVERDLICATADALAAAVSDDDSWVGHLRKCLSLHWSQSKNTALAEPLSQQIIFAIAVGLEVGANQGALTEIVYKRICQLGDENRFLAARLANWAHNGFRPRVAPFIEFVAGMYLDRPIERNAVCSAAEEALLSAQLLPDPWRLSFWIEQAWARGRRLVDRQPDLLRQLLLESPHGDRSYSLELYRSLVLKPTGSNERVDIERATLEFFALTEKGRCAVEYCAGDAPRKLARLAFDFVFWMGILSAMPLPDQLL